MHDRIKQIIEVEHMMIRKIYKHNFQPNDTKNNKYCCLQNIKKNNKKPKKIN